MRAPTGRDDDCGWRQHGRLTLAWPGVVILLIHNQYRTLGGEERVVDDLSRLIPEYLGEDSRILTCNPFMYSHWDSNPGLNIRSVQFYSAELQEY